MSFEYVFPILSYVNENEKKIVQNQEIKIWKKKRKENWSGDMVDRYLSLKLGVNPLDGFRENYVYGQTADARTPMS